MQKDRRGYFHPTPATAARASEHAEFARIPTVQDPSDGKNEGNKTEKAPQELEIV